MQSLQSYCKAQIYILQQTKQPASWRKDLWMINSYRTPWYKYASCNEEAPSSYTHTDTWS